MGPQNKLSLHFMLLSALFAVIVLYTTLITLHNLDDGSLLRRISLLVDDKTPVIIKNFVKETGYPLLSNISVPGISDAMKKKGYALPSYKKILGAPGSPSVGFIALKPFGPGSGFFPPEVKSGHSYLRQRTYPTTKRVDRCNNCFQFTYKTLLSPTICENKPTVDIFTIVTTVPGKANVRTAIRETWGKFSATEKGANASKPLFLFGNGWKPDEQDIIESEHQTHGDVLQADYIDSYYNLSIKVLSGYHWFKDHCNQAKYILRTADDNYINIPNMLSMVHREQKRIQNRISGNCAPGSHALRSTTSKWYVTKNEYPHSRYPPYCVGTAFLTSANLTRKIIETSVNVPYFVIEDVYIGMVVKEMNNGSIANSIVGIPGFAVPPPVANPRSGVCRYSGENWFTAHEIDAAQMKLIFEKCQGHLDWFNR